MAKFVPPEVGATFHRLTIIAEPFRANNSWSRASAQGRYWYVQVRCACGKVKAVQVAHLRAGSIKSCGCAFKDSLADVGRRFNPNGVRA